MKILLIEDEQRLAQHMESALTVAGYTVVAAGTLAAARQALEAERQELILLDLGLPDGDGLDFLREQRSRGLCCPVVILSARDGIEDRISGLDHGADDYMAKPFSVDELLARVRSFSRRLATYRAQTLSAREVSMDLLNRRVLHRGKPLLLTSREFALLEFFMQNPGRVLSRRLIAEKVWGVTYDLQTNLIEVYVRKLRQKLEAPGDAPFIRTLRGAGYIMDEGQHADAPLIAKDSDIGSTGAA